MSDTNPFFPIHQIRFLSHHHGNMNRELARELALRWTLTRRSDGSYDWKDLPPAAAAGATFSIHSQRGTVSVLQGSGTGLWLMRRDIIDSKVEGRTWRHEIFVADDGTSDLVGVRTSVALGRNMVAPVRPPAVIAALVRNCALVDDKMQVQIKPRTVTEHDAEPVFELLSSPVRSLPVLFISRPARGGKTLNAQKIADKLAGFAHVLVVMPDATSTVSRYLGKQFGVQLDAVTLCWPTSKVARGAVHTSWNMKQAKAQNFCAFIEAGVIRSSVGTRNDWLGALRAQLAI